MRTRLSQSNNLKNPTDFTSHLLVPGLFVVSVVHFSSYLTGLSSVMLI